jgi:hypothetical protein
MGSSTLKEVRQLSAKSDPGLDPRPEKDKGMNDET